jgi:hypothetical protein
MTRHYSHVGDDAALRAVALLPDVTQKAKKAKNELVLKLPTNVLKALDRAAKSHGKETHVQALELLIKAIKETKQMKRGAPSQVNVKDSNTRPMESLKRAAKAHSKEPNTNTPELLARAIKGARK